MFNFKQKQSIAAFNQFKTRAPSLLLSTTSFSKSPPQDLLRSPDQELSQWPREKAASQLQSQPAQVQSQAAAVKSNQSQGQKFLNQLSAILEQQAFYFKQENKRILKPLKGLYQNLQDFQLFLDTSIDKLTQYKHTLTHANNNQLELAVGQLVNLLRNKQRTQKSVLQRSSVCSLSPERSQIESRGRKVEYKKRGSSTKKQKKGGKKKRTYTKRRN